MYTDFQDFLLPRIMGLLSRGDCRASTVMDRASLEPLEIRLTEEGRHPQIREVLSESAARHTTTTNPLYNLEDRCSTCI